MRHLLLLACVTTSSFGADFLLNDVRVGFGTGVEYEQEINLVETIGKIDGSSDVVAATLQYVHGLNPIDSNGGLFLGGIIEYNHQEADMNVLGVSKIQMRTTLLGVGAQIGYAYALPQIERNHVELALAGSYFVGSEDRTFNSSNQGVGLRGFGYQVRLGNYYMCENGLQIGLELTYVIDRNLDSTAENGGASVGTTEQHQRGYILGVSLGTRF